MLSVLLSLLLIILDYVYTDMTCDYGLLAACVIDYIFASAYYSALDNRVISSSVAAIFIYNTLFCVRKVRIKV